MNDVLGVLWARAKIADLMGKNLKGIQQGKPNKEIKQMIINLGLKFKLMTQFTSFVAVEDKVINKDGKLVTVPVPVEMPDGVSHEGVFGAKDEASTSSYGKRANHKRIARRPTKTKPLPAPPPPPVSVPPVPIEEDGDDGPRDLEKKPVEKMDKSLKGLAEKVEKEGKNGNLKLSTFEVKNGRVNIILAVTHVSKKVLDQLKKAGVRLLNFSKTHKVIKGSISVKKLNGLMKFKFIKRIEPMPNK